MERKFDFGKVDYNRNGRKTCRVTAKAELTEDGRFSASACVWNQLGTDILMGGQCFDSLKQDFPELMENEQFAELYNIWENYHLNDMHAGTPEQEAAVREQFINRHRHGYGYRYDYSEACEILKAAGLYEVPDPRPGHEGELYRYGTAWLKEDLPESVVARIESLIGEGVPLKDDFEHQEDPEMA